jgi:sodium/bile acid cotransporter 7
MKLRVDGFLLSLGLVLALAWLLPGVGTALAAMHVNKLGVAVIFFLHGLLLSPQALRAGTLHLRLHALVQLSTFLLFPLLGWLASQLVPEALRPGVLFLSVLPSTVSSSVALTAVARGNVPAAVFNATLSSLIGVVLTPLWIRLLLETHDSGHASLPLGKVVLDLVVWLLLPLAAGQLMRPLLRAFAERHRPIVSKIDRASILLLVYTSFCESVSAGVWQHSGIRAVIISALTALCLLVTVLCLTALAARAFGFARADRITAIFCGSKKTLAAGVPMAQLIFGTGPSAGLVLLPLLAYHTLQLVVCGALATRWAQQEESSSP